MWRVYLSFSFCMLCDMWDRLMTRDQTCIPCIWSTVLNIGLPGKSHSCHFCPPAFNHLSFVNDTLFLFYKSLSLLPEWAQGRAGSALLKPLIYNTISGKGTLTSFFFWFTLRMLPRYLSFAKKKKLKGGNI